MLRAIYERIQINVEPKKCLDIRIDLIIHWSFHSTNNNVSITSLNIFCDTVKHLFFETNNRQNLFNTNDQTTTAEM